ncbi:MAG TPA: glycosyl hydrolase family 18 protein [Chitinispirillaceae bacterium]|nr:glycosyl hydrolase family 18 protein [Chitinispirillaceae bacterium]
MIKRIFLPCVILCFSVAELSAENIFGYFTNWGIYNKPYTALDIPYEKLTHILYAFFLPDTSGIILSSDQSADEKILSAPDDSTKSLVYLAHQNGVKVLPSIGGWDGSSNFPALAGSAQARSLFCSSVRALIEKYRFDGIDIDWEYPGYTEHNGTVQDAENFVLLLAELRDTLKAIDGEQLLTLAIAGSSYYGQNFIVERFVDYVDYISIMTYDYTGIWNTTSWHNSPLYSYGTADNWSLHKAMEYYTSRGVPKNKLNIGMAFHGQTFATCTGPGTSHGGAGSGEQGQSGVLTYSTIDKNIKSGLYTRHWDSLAGVPYCLSNTGEYCTYDDPISIGMKAEYCKKNGFGGTILWELKAGCASDSSQPLLDAVSSVLLPPAGYAFDKKKPPVISKLLIYNRMSGVEIVDQSSEFIACSIYDMRGCKVFSGTEKKYNNKFTISFNGMNRLHSGNYILQVTTHNGVYRTMYCHLIAYRTPKLSRQLDPLMRNGGR